MSSKGRPLARTLPENYYGEARSVEPPRKDRVPHGKNLKRRATVSLVKLIVPSCGHFFFHGVLFE